MPRPLNRAAVELRRILDAPGGIGRAEGARRIGVKRSTLDCWLSGHAKPRNRSLVEEEFPSVASRWWDQVSEERREGAAA